MRLYRVSNTRSSRLILSQNEHCCIKFAMNKRFAKSEENLKLVDITEDYVKWHTNSGCTQQHLNTLSEGFFVQIINHLGSVFKTD